jgi:hypothetical protein
MIAFENKAHGEDGRAAGAGGLPFSYVTCLGPSSTYSTQTVSFKFSRLSLSPWTVLYAGFDLHSDVRGLDSALQQVNITRHSR